MNRAALEHILRAAAAIANERDFIVIGSQAILGQYPTAPESLLMSIEADVSSVASGCFRNRRPAYRTSSMAITRPLTNDGRGVHHQSPHANNNASRQYHRRARRGPTTSACA
jgi:hypothetical protein